MIEAINSSSAVAFDTPRKLIVYGIKYGEPTILSVLLLLLFLWILIIFWVLRDSNSRTNSMGFQIFSLILVLFFTPILGLPLYLVLRPKHYLQDQIPWREAILSSFLECSNCKALNHPDHNVCVSCGESLKISCKECQKKYHYFYHYCPDCWAPNID